jgi:hypothetical protein
MRILWENGKGSGGGSVRSEKDEDDCRMYVLINVLEWWTCSS